MLIKMVSKIILQLENDLLNINLGKFCHALLTKTARWKIGTTLVEVVKATVEHIDNPDIDYSINHG